MKFLVYIPIMMGQQRSEDGLFSYRINLHHRVLAAVDFEFVRAEVAMGAKAMCRWIPPCSSK